MVGADVDGTPVWTHRRISNNVLMSLQTYDLRRLLATSAFDDIFDTGFEASDAP